MTDVAFFVVELVFLPTDFFAVEIFLPEAVGTFLTDFLTAALVAFLGDFLTTDFAEAGFLELTLLAGLRALLTGFETLGSGAVLPNLTLPLAPLGSAKMPFSAPRVMALFNRLTLEGVSRILNRKARYFLMAGRLTPPRTFSLSFLIASLIISSKESLVSPEALDGEDFLEAVAFLVVDETGFLEAETGFLTEPAGLAFDETGFDLETGLAALELGLEAGAAGDWCAAMTWGSMGAGREGEADMARMWERR